MLFSLYKQSAPHLKIGVCKSKMVCDIDTNWALAAAIIIVQLVTLLLYLTTQNDNYFLQCRYEYITLTTISTLFFSSSLPFYNFQLFHYWS